MDKHEKWKSSCFFPQREGPSKASQGFGQRILAVVPRTLWDCLRMLVNDRNTPNAPRMQTSLSSPHEVVQKTKRIINYKFNWSAVKTTQLI